jgi:hypothetical protein
MPTLPAPLDRADPDRPSLDATDWRMYCDLLQDAGAPQDEWQRADRIANSLAVDSKLVLINFCPPGPLNNHWLRVGHTWFIGAEATMIDANRLVWWRPAWVRDGFERYPSNDPDRNEARLIALNYGTPWNLPHPRLHCVQGKPSIYAEFITAFFDGHALAEIPQEYL